LLNHILPVCICWFTV